MLLDFSISNFYSIKDKITLSFIANNDNTLEEYHIINAKTQTKDIRLLKLGVIFGANASGKSTIIKAIHFLKNLIIKPQEEKHSILNYRTFQFTDLVNENVSKIEINFLANSIPFSYIIDFNHDMIFRETLYFHCPNKALLFDRSTELNSINSKILFGSKTKVPLEAKKMFELNVFRNNTALSTIASSTFNINEVNIAYEWFENYLYNEINSNYWDDDNLYDQLINLKDSKSDILQILAKSGFSISDFIYFDNIKQNKVNDFSIIYNDMQNFKSRTASFFVQYKSANSDYFILPFNYESIGTKKYIFYSILLFKLINNQILLTLDDFESSIHPDLLKHFLLMFLTNSSNSQLIATTFARELLDMEILRNDNIWFTEMKTDRSIDLFSLDAFPTNVLRKAHSKYNAYKSGRLGAIPNLYDYKLNFGTNYEEGYQ